MVLPMELDPLEALAVSSTPSLDSGDVLAPSSEALFAKELCGLLACLEATSPGYGKDIACVLAGKASEMAKKRKRGISMKASSDAWS